MNQCFCALLQSKKSVGTWFLCPVFVGGGSGAAASLQHKDDLIIITSSLGRVLRGGVNAQWVKAFLGDVEHFVVLRDNKVCMGSVRWGTKSITSHGLDAEHSGESKV